MSVFQLTRQLVTFALKDYILKDSIQKKRLVYDSLTKAAHQQYDYSAAAVAVLAEWSYDQGHRQPAIDVLVFCTELDPGISTGMSATYKMPGPKKARL